MNYCYSALQLLHFLLQRIVHVVLFSILYVHDSEVNIRHAEDDYNKRMH